MLKGRWLSNTTRHTDPPQLAGNLALMIQALVLLFVGADLLIIYIWQARRKLRLGGAKADSTKPGFGLFSIRERLRQLGGQMELRSAPGSGTSVTLRLPAPSAD